MPAPRSQWKGFLKLSLVSCPIALYPAITDANKIRFRQVNRRTGNRLRHQLVDTVTGEAMESHDKGRGYEIGKHQFLTVEDHEIETARAAAAAPPPPIERPSSVIELRKGPGARPARMAVAEIESDEDEEDVAPPAPPLRLENDHTIDIERFVPRTQIDPAYFEKAYFIVPTEPVGQEAFAVVRDAMGESGMIALGHVILSNRRRPIAIEAYGKGLRGFLLRHLHEVRSEAEYFSDIPDMELPREMLTLAKHILKTKSGDFDPSFLEDKYQQALVSVLRRKHGAAAMAESPVTPSRENVVNIMDALRRSLEAEGRTVPKPTPRRGPSRPLAIKRPTPRRRKAS